MICSDFNKLLDSYETLNENQLENLNSHAAECENCRNELNFFKSIIETSASIPNPVPPKSLIDEVNKRLDASSNIGTIREEKPRFWSNMQGFATIAACLAVGLTVGLNAGYIKNSLKDNSESGVIKEVVTDDNAGTDVPQKSEDNATESKTQHEAQPKTQNTKTVDKGTKADEKPASKADAPAVAEDKKDTAAVVSVTEKPHKDNNVPIPAKDTENSYISQEANNKPEAPATAEPTGAPDVSGYSIDEPATIAFGYYNAPRETKVKYITADYLLVNGEDMGAVVSIMSEMGVVCSQGFYMTPRANFYALLNRFDEEGIIYAYDLNYNSSDNIAFELRYN